MSRTQLLVPTDFFVSKAPTGTTACWPGTSTVMIPGNDTTGNGTITAPWATPQKGIDWVYANLDLGGIEGHRLRLAQVAGQQWVYEGMAFHGLFTGQRGRFGVVGDPTGADIVGALIIPTVGSALEINGGAKIWARGFLVQTQVSNADCIALGNAGTEFSFRDLYFSHAGLSGPYNHISVAFGAFLQVDGNYTIGGDAQCHIDLGALSTLYVATDGNPSLAILTTLIGTRTFRNWVNPSDGGFMFCDGSYANAQQWHFTGPQAYGTTVVSENGGRVNTASGGGTNYFPGNVAPIIRDYSTYN